MKSNHKLVFIIGPARSGTTMLGRILSKIDDAVYVEEPTGVWTPLFYSGNSDEIGVECYKDKDIKRIRHWFYKKLADSGKTILIEKSPANSLRPSVVRTIFPEAYIIYLTRDPSAIAKSSLKQWNYMLSNESLSNRNVIFSIFLARLRKFLQLSLLQKASFIHQRITQRTARTWGPRYASIDADTQQLNIPEICYKQASLSLQCINDAYSCSSSKAILVRYEDLMDLPSASLSKIFFLINYDVKPDELLSLSLRVSPSGG